MSYLSVKNISSLEYKVMKDHCNSFYFLLYQTHISNTKIPYTDLKSLINKFILKKWQKSWDDQTQNKLHHIQDTIGEWPAGHRRNRKEEVIISKLCIGHTHITHSHLLNREDSPVCLTSKVPLTVKHILINCDRFRQICPKHYQMNNLNDLFKNSKPEEILSFLKEINLFIKTLSNIIKQLKLLP